MIQTLSSLQSVHELSSLSHQCLLETIELILNSSTTPQGKLTIEISQFEELASMATTLIKNDRTQKELTRSLQNSSKVLHRTKEKLKKVKTQLLLTRTSFEEDQLNLNKLLSTLGHVQKEFKSRCQVNFLDYLKGVDIDLRKILKPLVPCSVIREQVKFPLINTNSSLRSSVQSLEESAGETFEDTNVKSQPEPEEVTIQKLNTHIQMLVGTLENIAKDLIQVLAEADREYYQLLNKQDVYSRPPTPLAAPLPDYFCYELQDSPRDVQYRQSISNETRLIWVNRLKLLHENNGIKDTIYKIVLGKLEKLSETRKLDLKEIFVNTEVSISERENLVYYLINGPREISMDVSMSQIMSESKLKPEPPKNPKPKAKLVQADRRASPVNNPDLEVARISQGSVQPHGRILNSIRLVSKSPKIERLFKNRKSVRVRSITPVGKEKMTSQKARTPSVQNNKVSLSTFYAKHRLRKTPL